MTKRHGKPGMAPSPNQQIVLDELRELVTTLRLATPDHPVWGVGINAIHSHLRDVYDVKGFGGTEHGPWSRSTVRDHLNDLVLKGHVTKWLMAQTAYYLPTEKP